MGERGVTTPYTSDSLNGPTSLRSLAFEPSEANWAMQCAEAETATPVVVLLAEGRRTAGGERESKQGGRQTLACLLELGVVDDGREQQRAKLPIQAAPCSAPLQGTEGRRGNRGEAAGALDGRPKSSPAEALV